MIFKTSRTPPRCHCCGTCCRKGGPTLQKEDTALLAAGILPLRALLTLRRGELAWDEAAGHVRPQPHEAIKIAGTGEATYPWHCIFHRTDNLCGIHAHRPAQCRALLCEDTTALEALYSQGQIDRAAVLAALPPHPGWIEIIAAHEEACSVQDMADLATRAVRGSRDDRNHAAQLLGAMLRQDAAFRALCVEKAGIASEDIPFLLGRPLSVLLEGTGLAAEPCHGDGWRIYPTQQQRWRT